MRKRRFNGGYSKEVVKENLFIEKHIINLSKVAVPQYRWENSERTSDVIGYKSWFIQEGTDPFEVKFETKPTLPPFLSEVSFDDLEGCEVRSNVYFRAK
ncbi:hypothetical protein J2Z60_000388 [Lactobacillus colini]|uniref:SuB0782 undefined product 764400:764714 forward MW:11955 n=1 Tax=Lactobacillus colini TaxID=1819254 RepID=A0ABS4MC30_9LACO|nr:hypothetical protein [Lactobacillus colini]MBP2057224.1 hypothetical protein [Lactobacillus colini]